MTSTSKVSAASLFSVCVVLLAVFYYRKDDRDFADRLDNILAGLLHAEDSATLILDDTNTTPRNIAIGYGSCEDIIVQSSDVLPSSESPDQVEHFYSIATKEQLLKVFAYFFQHGAAAERYVSNKTLFNELVAASRRSKTSRHAMGGNAPVMATRFVKEGFTVLLGAHMSKAMHAKLPEGISIAGPYVDEDDIHLLLEYPAGEKWGKYVAPRANRFIIHNDFQNPHLSSMDGFHKRLTSFKPSLLVIGGLQVLDNFPFEQNVRRERLRKVREMMESQPMSTRIHFEMASFTEEALLKELVEDIIPCADSLGMNEQELPNLKHILAYGNITLVSEAYPRVANILDQMRELFKLLEEVKGCRQLTRLHVHTLAFQAIMTRKGSPWKNSMSATAKASLTAHRHTCGSHEIDVNKAKLILDNSFTTTSNGEVPKRRIEFDPEHPVACWDEGSLEVCVAPVLVCTKVLQTGGGGDNISSAGLVLQI